MATENIALTTLTEGMASAEIKVNESYNVLDAFVFLAIQDRDLAAPPGSPTNGHAYLVAGSPTGDWAGQAGKIAIYYSGWRFFTPKEGWRAWIIDENCFMVYDGAAWQIGTAVASLTDSTTGTADDTVADVGASFSQGVLNNNFADLTAKVNAILASLRAAGILKT